MKLARPVLAIDNPPVPRSRDTDFGRHFVAHSSGIKASCADDIVLIIRSLVRVGYNSVVHLVCKNISTIFKRGIAKKREKNEFRENVNKITYRWCGTGFRTDFQQGKRPI